MVSVFLKGSGCLYEGNRPYADGGDLWTHRVLVAVWTAKSTSIVCCLGELPRVTDTLDAIIGRNILVITILSRSCYLAIAPIHLPRAPASRGDEEGQGLAGSRVKPLPLDGAERHVAASSVPFGSELGREGAAGCFPCQGSRFFQMILVWCSGLSIYISNLMAHKLLAKWFHYSPSVSYERERSSERQEGSVGAGGGRWTLVSSDAAAFKSWLRLPPSSGDATNLIRFQGSLTRPLSTQRLPSLCLSLHPSLPIRPEHPGS